KLVGHPEAPSVVVANECNTIQLPQPDPDERVDARHMQPCTYPSLLIQTVRRARDVPQSPLAAGDDASHVAAQEEAARCYDDCAGEHEMALTTTSELIAVTPRRHFRSLRLANADELEAFRNSREPDVVRRHAQSCRTEQPLALLDGFPAFLDRREIPSLTFSADHPQASTRGIERQTSTDREMLDRFVLAQIRVAEDAGGIHTPQTLDARLRTDDRR